MGMFDNYKNLDPDYIPNNQHKCIPFKSYNIIAGGNSSLLFELPKFYSEGLQKVTIIFNQEQRLTMIKLPQEVIVEGHHMFVECKLSPSESLEFGGTNLDTLVQLKLEYEDRIMYTEIEKIKVIETLESDENIII